VSTDTPISCPFPFPDRRAAPSRSANWFSLRSRPTTMTTAPGWSTSGQFTTSARFESFNSSLQFQCCTRLSPRCGCATRALDPYGHGYSPCKQSIAGSPPSFRLPRHVAGPPGETIISLAWPEAHTQVQLVYRIRELYTVYTAIQIYRLLPSTINLSPNRR
jgi:hypothetical protein